MPTLRIEHQVADYGGWKEAFDSDPVGRKQSGVRRYVISRAIDNPDFVTIDLEFASADDAEGLLAAMRDIWRVVEPAGLVTGPQARVVEAVETKEC
jgi:hypothetical protein